MEPRAGGGFLGEGEGMPTILLLVHAHVEVEPFVFAP